MKKFTACGVLSAFLLCINSCAKTVCHHNCSLDNPSEISKSRDIRIGNCELLAAAGQSQAEAGMPWKNDIIKLIEKMYRPYLALTGNQASFKIYDESIDKYNDLSVGVTCPVSKTTQVTTPTIYLRRDFIDRVYSEKSIDQEAVLAFVIGHELGHREDDIAQNGELKSDRSFGFNRDLNLPIEVVADRRAAFYTTMAGFSTSRLSEQRAIDRLLEASGARPKDRQNRENALRETVKAYENYELYYTNVFAVLFRPVKPGSTTYAASQVAGYLLELMKMERVDVPEFSMLYAAALINEARKDAPWLKFTEVNDVMQGMGELVNCGIIVSYQTALGKDLDMAQSTTLMNSASVVSEERAKRAESALDTAIKVLEKSYSQNNSLSKNALLMCAYLYKAEWENATSAYVKAKDDAGLASDSVKISLERNKVLLDAAQWLNKNAYDANQDAEWRVQLHEVAKTSYERYPELQKYLTSISKQITVETSVSIDKTPQVLNNIVASNIFAREQDGSLSWRDTSDCPAGTTADNNSLSSVFKKCNGSGFDLMRIKMTGSLVPPPEDVVVDVFHLETSTFSQKEKKDLFASCKNIYAVGASFQKDETVYAGFCDGHPIVLIGDKNLNKISNLYIIIDG